MLLLLLWRPPAPAAAITHFPACCFAPLPLPPCLPACPPCIILLPPPLPQNHSNEDIYEKAVAILEAYFDVEDGEEENLAPAVAETGGWVGGWVARWGGGAVDVANGHGGGGVSGCWVGRQGGRAGTPALA